MLLFLATGRDADEGLSPTEVALIMKMREGRDSYLPGRCSSYEEAVEMVSSYFNRNLDCFICENSTRVLTKEASGCLYSVANPQDC